MSSYLYELPTTGAVSFSDYTYDQTASYIAEVSDTTEARANLRAALKESKRTDEKDFLKLIKVCVGQPTSSFFLLKTVYSIYIGLTDSV